MKFKPIFVAVWCAVLFFAIARNAFAAEIETTGEVRQPHTPTLIFYLAGVGGQQDADGIRAAVQKLKGATTVAVNTNRSYARIRFDSHVVSYHQVAQALADAGATLGKSYRPFLIFSVAEYARSNNAAAVDAIFAGKRLNTRVTVKPLDKTKGLFEVYFLPLKVDPHQAGPEGFNGGHLHHPISDPPPRGLGLTFRLRFRRQSHGPIIVFQGLMLLGAVTFGKEHTWMQGSDLRTEP